MFSEALRPTLTAMEVINQVLIIGKRVYGFNVTRFNAIAVVECFKYWSYRVGGAACGRNNGIFWLNHLFIDTKDDVFDVAFTRRSQ
ncbi:hypothetical protein VSVS05_04304 [Vibrio scophthalmi]|uniref:Uncharacterized protein n=1 Tax=Vibrio scophthalmi TaxID=45658 RepID=A0A1C7FH88_9VIBR|nr:hypothetical protein VSVS05_04304 [Vibrio scophthalmi]